MASKSIHDLRYARLAEVLAAARRERGVTQVELAKRIGREQTFISKYENRVQALDVIEFLDVCSALDLDPARVLRQAARQRRTR